MAYDKTVSAERRCVVWSLVCLAAAVALLLCGWLMPVYLQAVDAAVVEAAGKTYPSPSTKNPAETSALSGAAAALGLDGNVVTPCVIRPQVREKALALLRNAPLPAVQALLRCRALTNTVLFPPSSSASGQAFDTAVVITGLLLDGHHLTPSLNDTAFADASAAMQGGSPAPLENILMDELSLGQRFDWAQLAVFNDHIENAATLGALAGEARKAGDQLPVLYEAVAMSEQPAAVARYLDNFSRTGLPDLAKAERAGAGGVTELIRQNKRLYDPEMRRRVVSLPAVAAFFRTATNYAANEPRLALFLKWFFYLSAGFLAAIALQLARPRTWGGDASAQPGGFFMARELLVASGILVIALLVSEPYLAQENQKGEGSSRPHVSLWSGAAANQVTSAKPSLMNTQNVTVGLLTLGLFFVLQALIYTACLARLNATLRQNVPARVKLKLLENEDHLFDSGLYLGFVGTIVCFILVSVTPIQFNLMAAYSSTSFGIIFVSVLKIFKVRPARRQLLLQAEAENTALPAEAPVAAHTLATAP